MLPWLLASSLLPLPLLHLPCTVQHLMPIHSPCPCRRKRARHCTWLFHAPTAHASDTQWCERRTGAALVGPHRLVQPQPAYRRDDAPGRWEKVERKKRSQHLNSASEVDRSILSSVRQISGMLEILTRAGEATYGRCQTAYKPGRTTTVDDSCASPRPRELSARGLGAGRAVSRGACLNGGVPAGENAERVTDMGERRERDKVRTAGGTQEHWTGRSPSTWPGQLTNRGTARTH
ncbi:hypothetical protein K438DRAFT_1748421 [Mycena galopus ATCC 62051]|nr:hypothetical protein K438DRAFT_1748421 [Mycena galopus ATCC 62051]